MKRLLIILTMILSFSLQSFNLFASQKFNNPVEYDTGVTSLMNAVAAADYKAIEFFIKINPLEIDKQNIGGASALHLAVRNNDPIATKILIDHRSNPNLQDLEGYSPAMRACFYGYNDIFKIIQKDSSIDYTLLNNQQDGFIILSALAKNSFCLENVLQNIIPMRDLTVLELKDRLNRAFTISLAKEDQESKAVLLKYLNKLHKFQKKVRELKYSQPEPVMSSVPVQKFDTIEFELTKPKKGLKRPVIVNKSYELKRGSKGLKIEKPQPRKRYKIKKPKPPKKPKYKLKSKIIKKEPVKNDIVSQKPIIEKSKIVQMELAKPKEAPSRVSENTKNDDALVIDESIL